MTSRAAPTRTRQKKTSYNGNDNLKKVGVPIEFTKEQLSEYIRCSEDPVYFIENYVKIVSIDKGLILFKMYDFQKEYIKVLHTNQKVVSKIGRQSGKTQCNAAYLLWYALFNNDKTIAIVANKLGAAKEVLSRIQLMYVNLPLFIQQGVNEFNKTSMSLENGSKMICAATSGTALTGKSIAFLYIDEAAVISNSVAEEFFASVFPTLSSGKSSRVTMSSTPRGYNHYHKFWVEAVNGTNGFTPFEAKWQDVPTRDEKWLAKQLVELGEVKFRREVLCEFSGSIKTLIRSDIIGSLPATAPIQTDATETTKIFERPIEGHQYMATVDCSRGLEEDYSTITVIDVSETPFRVAATYRDNTISPLVFPERIRQLATYYNEAMVLVEVNDIGQAIVDSLYYELEYENVFRTSKETILGWKGQEYFGVRTTKKTKRIGCDAFKNLLESHLIDVRDKTTIDEISTFVMKGASYAADDNYHDDMVMGLVLFSWATTQPFFKEEFGTEKSVLIGKSLEEVTSQNKTVSIGVDDTIGLVQVIQEVDPKNKNWMFEEVYQKKFQEVFGQSDDDIDNQFMIGAF